MLTLMSPHILLDIQCRPLHCWLYCSASVTDVRWELFGRFQPDRLTTSQQRTRASTYHSTSTTKHANVWFYNTFYNTIKLSCRIHHWMDYHECRRFKISLLFPDYQDLFHLWNGFWFWTEAKVFKHSVKFENKNKSIKNLLTPRVSITLDWW